MDVSILQPSALHALILIGFSIDDRDFVTGAVEMIGSQTEAVGLTNLLLFNSHRLFRTDDRFFWSRAVNVNGRMERLDHPTFCPHCY
ncbi:hypothetical protein AVEN_237204-1 [Araneus ventricosus]|uniref:Uncharacterized protein n=1 Tax=Araneus ventricosus TaxID=182803 RepID=A0A4Y2HXF2_ARAVE|nr:hypothetical protein AVEN_237204-1 [Araneus ventricosus]